MTHDIERRDFLHGAGLAAGAAAASTLIQRPARAQATLQPGAKPMAYEIKPFSLDPKSVKGISEKVLISHYENNYVGAVKRLTAIAAQLAELDFAKAPGFVINGLKREELVDELDDPARGLFRQSWRRWRGAWRTRRHDRTRFRQR